MSRRRIAATAGVALAVAGLGAWLITARAAYAHCDTLDGPVVTAAKAALEAHVRQLALELASAGVTVNIIRAGVTDTPALRRIPGWEQLVEAAIARNPNARLTQPEDVADALTVLATPQTQWISGSVIAVDGGEVMGSRESADID